MVRGSLVPGSLGPAPVGLMADAVTSTSAGSVGSQGGWAARGGEEAEGDIQGVQAAPLRNSMSRCLLPSEEITTITPT